MNAKKKVILNALRKDNVPSDIELVEGYLKDKGELQDAEIMDYEVFSMSNNRISIVVKYNWYPSSGPSQAVLSRGYYDLERNFYEVESEDSTSDMSRWEHLR